MKNIKKAYDSKKYEDSIYKTWEAEGTFTPKIDKKKKPFSIMMPPPNATGTLHLGHAVMLAIQDILIRYHRMNGEVSLWLPGTDHAAIATQNKVEKLLAEKKLTRHDLGRTKFLEEVHKFVKNSQNTIRNQVRKMGASCDWTRERYTLEESLNRAVREIFVRMYNDNLIYRGNRIVNWCPRCGSTLADDEVKYKEEKTKFYYIKYGPIIIGTARPETKFADKVILVHPDDKRYKKYHGKKITVDWINGPVQATFLADKRADPTFGSGAMTITPAHSFIDFEIAQEHGFEILQIIGQDGKMTEVAGEFAGMSASECREKLVKKMQAKGLIDHIDENYTHNLSVCYRCGAPVEPLVSKQWFIDVNKKIKGKKSLKERALEVVRKKKIEILPEKFEKTYFHWIENLRDWCISRQIWFGHQIPVWYCKDCNEIIVAKEAPKSCPKCKTRNPGVLKQDSDTLDTWFSSGLWTFSTLGWPEKTKELKYFHPTSVMETGYDILFFWVARMIIMTLYALDEVPFKTVYLHGLVRDKNGEKMSKSKPETCIDPLDMIKKYGADAVRLSLVIGSTPGNDTRLYEEKIAGYRNFTNKVWNASRFVLMNVSEEDIKKFRDKKLQPRDLKTHADKWMVTRIQELIHQVTKHLDGFALSEAGTQIYDTLWCDLCDWYLEISKSELKNPAVLLYSLKTILRLLHPFTPFVTEAIWKNLGEEGMLISENWPKVDKKFIFKEEEEEMQLIHDIICELRRLRTECKVEPSKKIAAIIYGKQMSSLIYAKREPIMRMAGLESLDIHDAGTKPENSISCFIGKNIEIHLPLESLVDPEKERIRLKKEIGELQKYIEMLRIKLSTKNFIEKAPTKLVEDHKIKLSESEEKLKKLEKQLCDLG